MRVATNLGAHHPAHLGEQLAHRLRRALEDGRIDVHFQPIIDLTTGRATGVEALARWSDPDLGRIPPNDFIPVAEASGLIVPLGALVLRAACAEVSRWTRDRPEIGPITTSVNVSARQLLRPGFVATVQDALTRSGCHPTRLCLEVTESVLLDDLAGATSVMSQLRDLGVRLAFDDFGTGFSSLTYLQRLPADIVKLDRSFVMGLDDPVSHGRDRTIIAAVIDLAHALGMTTVGEGVETPAQREVLQSLGCEAGQGHLWSPAQDGATAAAWLTDHRSARAT